jgi:hypothetical protein
VTEWLGDEAACKSVIMVGSVTDSDDVCACECDQRDCVNMIVSYPSSGALVLSVTPPLRYDEVGCAASMRVCAYARAQPP